MPIREFEKKAPINLGLDWRAGSGVHARDRVAIVRGIVEFNRDPDHRGRVKVRVAEDGPEYSNRFPDKPRFATLSLDWCLPLFGHGSGMGFGSFTVPPVGARVYVMYERAHPEQPVYFGGWVANAARRKRYGVTGTTLDPPRKETEEEEGFNESGGKGGDYMLPPRPTEYQGYWEEEQGPELPLELADMVDHTPDTQMFFKTLKGASLLVKERDEVEEMVLTDRLGAELRFESNTPLLENGVLRRGRVSGTQHEPMSLDNLSHFTHNVSLVNAVRSGLEISSGTIGDDNSIKLDIHPEQTQKKNTELFDTRAAMELDPGEDRIKLLYRENSEDLGYIIFDRVGRRLDIVGMQSLAISSTEEVAITAPKIKLTGDIDIEGEVSYFGNQKSVFIDADMEPCGTPFRNYIPCSTWSSIWRGTREYKR